MECLSDGSVGTLGARRQDFTSYPIVLNGKLTSEIGEGVGLLLCDNYVGDIGVSSPVRRGHC